jgi:hypothetical protein
MTRDMTRLTNMLSVNNFEGCDLTNRYFICRKWLGIWLDYPILYLSEMTRDKTKLTDALSATNDEEYE